MKSGWVNGVVRGWGKAFPNPGFFGWVIVGMGFLASALSSPGQSFAISLFIEEVIESLGVSRLAVSSFYGGMTLLAALCLPWVGALADRVTGRVFLGGNLLLLGLAVGFFGMIQNLWMLAVAFFLLRLLGQGGIGLGTLTETVRWFRRFRGRALAVVGLGYAFGELVYPFVIVALIGLVGWRWTLGSMSIFYVLVAAPLFFWVMRSRRADESWDGRGARRGDDGRGVDEEEDEEERSFALGEALKTPVFWGLLGSVSVLPMVVTAVIFHQVALFEDRGWGFEMVPVSFMFFALASVVTSYGSGLMLETRPIRWGITVGMTIAAVALGVAYVSTGGVWMAILYGLLLGAAGGIMTSTNSLLWPEYYGIEALGAIKGVVNGVRNGSTAVGPPLVAVLLGPGEEFGLALLVLAGISVVPAVVAPWLKRPVRPEHP